MATLLEQFCIAAEKQQRRFPCTTLSPERDRGVNQLLTERLQSDTCKQATTISYCVLLQATVELTSALLVVPQLRLQMACKGAPLLLTDTRLLVMNLYFSAAGLSQSGSTGAGAGAAATTCKKRRLLPGDATCLCAVCCC